MFGKRGTRTLLIVLAALPVIYFLSSVRSTRARERSFKEYVMQLDTAMVKRVEFQPRRTKPDPMQLDRTGTDWTVTHKGITARADNGTVRSLLEKFVAMRTVRVSGMMDKMKDGAELNDSLAIPITFTLDDGTTQELLVGRNSNSPDGRDFWTQVNIPGEKEIYAVSAVLTGQLDQEMSAWRVRTLVKGDPTSWQRLSFTYPADSGYVLQRNGAEWLVDEMPADSAKVNKYLKSLALSRVQQFADTVNVSSLAPMHQLRIDDSASPEPIVVQVYAWGNGYVVTSTLNPGGVMHFDAFREMPRLFRPRHAWFVTGP